MKEFILAEENKSTIDLWRVDASRGIFAKKGGKLVGMLLKEGGRWIIRHSSGSVIAHSDTREECLLAAIGFGYTFHVED